MATKVNIEKEKIEEKELKDKIMTRIKKTFSY